MDPSIALATAVFAVLFAAELTWARWRGVRVHDVRESLSNLTMLVVSSGLKSVALAWSILVMSLLEPLQLVRLPDTTWAFAATFVVTDLAYYWYHRVSHEVSFFWTMHHTHHSSPWMNLTTAVRLNWIAKFISPVFFAPLVLLGADPLQVGASLGLALLYQFFLHTEAIGRLGWFEGKLLNTPSAHRVHHASNAQYIDKNYAGVFVVWDRLFGTYEPEVEKVKYGVTTGFVSHNPLTIQFRPLLTYLRGRWRTERANLAATSLAERGSASGRVPANGC